MDRLFAFGIGEILSNRTVYTNLHKSARVVLHCPAILEPRLFKGRIDVFATGDVGVFHHIGAFDLGKKFPGFLRGLESWGYHRKLQNALADHFPVVSRAVEFASVQDCGLSGHLHQPLCGDVRCNLFWSHSAIGKTIHDASWPS